MFGGSGLDPHPDAAERYPRSHEFIDVVGELWHSWGEGAIVGDKESGLSARPELVCPIDFVEYCRIGAPGDKNSLARVSVAGLRSPGKYAAPRV